MLKTIISTISALFFLVGCQHTNVKTTQSGNQSAAQGINTQAIKGVIQQAQKSSAQKNPASEFVLNQNRGKYNQTSQYSDAPFNLAVKSVEDYIEAWLLRPTEVTPFTLSMPEKPAIPEASVLTKGEFETTKQFQIRLAEEKLKFNETLQSLRKNYVAKVEAYNSAIQSHNSEIQWEQKIREERVNSIRVRLLGTAINEVLGAPKLANLEYNADKEVFTAKVIAANATVSYDVLIPVAIVDAPDFKKTVEQSSVAIKMDVTGKIKPVNFKINDSKGVVYTAYLVETKDAITKQRSTGVDDLDLNDVVIDKANTLKVDTIIDRNEKYFGKFF